MTPEERTIAAHARGFYVHPDTMVEIRKAATEARETPVHVGTVAAFRHSSGLPLIENPAVPAGYLVPILDERFEYVCSFTEAPPDGPR